MNILTTSFNFNPYLPISPLLLYILSISSVTVADWPLLIKNMDYTDPAKTSFALGKVINLLLLLKYRNKKIKRFIKSNLQVPNIMYIIYIRKETQIRPEQVVLY